MTRIAVFKRVTVIPTLLLIVACENSTPVGSLGRLQTHDGALAFEGTFSDGPDLRLDLPEKFRFDARGIAPSDGSEIFGAWFEGGIPPIGTYEFTVPDWNRHQGLWMFYQERRGRGYDNYPIFAGVLEITVSAIDRVEGRFVARGWLLCPAEELICPDLDGVVPNDAETIDLSGTFVLDRWDGITIPD